MCGGRGILRNGFDNFFGEIFRAGAAFCESLGEGAVDSAFRAVSGYPIQFVVRIRREPIDGGDRWHPEFLEDFDVLAEVGQATFEISSSALVAYTPHGGDENGRCRGDARL